MTQSVALADRIDAEFAASERKIEQFKSERAQAFQERQQRLESLEAILDQLRDIWRPRLESLAKKFGERVSVHPQVEPSRRSARFEFKSELARISLRFSAAPDSDVRKLFISYDLDIIPILMKFQAHNELEVPLDHIDQLRIANWLDDQIISFVKTYLELHQNQFYLKDHLVEDPIAKVTFPKYAAAAQADVSGKTYYFIDESTRREFLQKH